MRLKTGFWGWMAASITSRCELGRVSRFLQSQSLGTVSFSDSKDRMSTYDTAFISHIVSLA
jgi:hypothetical protein